MNNLKDTVIRINHDSNTATITVRQKRYIRKYMAMAEGNEEWKLLRLKKDKHQRISSISYAFPAQRLNIRRPLPQKKLEAARERAAYAREQINRKKD